MKKLTKIFKSKIFLITLWFVSTVIISTFISFFLNLFMFRALLDPLSAQKTLVRIYEDSIYKHMWSEEYLLHFHEKYSQYEKEHIKVEMKAQREAKRIWGQNKLREVQEEDKRQKEARQKELEEQKNVILALKKEQTRLELQRQSIIYKLNLIDSQDKKYYMLKDIEKEIMSNP